MCAESKRARLALIGCGGHSTYNLSPVFPQLADAVELVAVCDLKEERAEHTARYGGARRWHSNLKAMLDEENLDGVLIAGSPRMQIDVATRVLERGLPILVESPPAVSFDEAVGIANLAEKSGTFGMVGFMRRFGLGYRMAKHLVEQPEFGGVHVVEAMFCRGPFQKVWDLEWPALGFLAAEGIHFFDLLRHFGGDIERLCASYRGATATQFAFTANLMFRGGAVGTLSLSSLVAEEASPGFQERLSVSGLDHTVSVEDMTSLTYKPSKVSVEIPGLGIGRLDNTWRPGWPGAPKTEELVGYRGEIEYFASCALSGERPSPDLFDGAAALQITEAVWQSARGGKSVELSPMRQG